ncbi:hypothetical protein ABK040_012509 [Willaertia magna]
MFQRISYEILSQQEDVMLHIFSFLNLQSIYHITLTNRKFHEMLSNQQADRCVYGSILFRLFSQFLKEIVKEDEFYKIIQKELNFTFLDVLKEYFTKPFTKQTYQSNAYNNYCNNGGVVDILLWKPCFLLNFIYQQYFNNLNDNLKITIFKYLLILSVNNNEENNSNGDISFNISFVSQPRPIKSYYYAKEKMEYPILEKEYVLNPGQLLLQMSNDFNHLLLNYNKLYNNTKEINKDHKEIKEEEINKEEKNNEKNRPIIWNDSFELDYQLIGNQYSNEINEDIFEQAANPPYGLEQNNEELDEMRSELYSSLLTSSEVTLSKQEENVCYSIDWMNCVTYETCWSIYWLAGLEWWGTYGITTYNKKTNLFIVATASASD